MDYQRWNNFKGKIRLFKNEFEDGKKTFSTSISNKLEDGSYENMYLPVGFKKSLDVSSLGDEIVGEGFITFYKTTYKDENGEEKEVKRPKLMVMEIIDAGAVKEDFISIGDTDDLDDLPF